MQLGHLLNLKKQGSLNVAKYAGLSVTQIVAGIRDRRPLRELEPGTQYHKTHFACDWLSKIKLLAEQSLTKDEHLKLSDCDPPQTGTSNNLVWKPSSTFGTSKRLFSTPFTRTLASNSLSFLIIPSSVRAADTSVTRPVSYMLEKTRIASTLDICYYIRLRDFP